MENAKFEDVFAKKKDVPLLCCQRVKRNQLFSSFGSIQIIEVMGPWEI